MQGNENQDVNAPPSGPEQDNSGDTPQLSAKLRDKLSKFAKWRIDPSSIQFSKNPREFSGGFATVARAALGVTFNPWDGSVVISKDVAIKKLKVEKGGDSQQVLGLALREAGFLFENCHQNIIELVGFVEDIANDRIWLIFPWEEHGNLKDFAAARDWEIPERISLINDVAAGVEYLHSRTPPICHGDLKSINILVNCKYRAVITDFGSARRLSTKARAPDTQTNQSENGALTKLVLETTICATTSTITLTGNSYTLRWAAPELLKDEEPGLWSDIWSLGWICYEVMTNSIPFENIKKDSMVVIHVIQGILPSASDDTRMKLVQALCSLMKECWSIDPSKRPSAEDCRNSTNRMPKIIPEGVGQTSDQSASSDFSPRRLVALGAIHQLQEDYTEASSLLNKALTTSTNTGDDEVKVLALQSLAEMHMSQNKYREAASCYSVLLKILSDKEEIGKVLLDLAHAQQLLKEYKEAAPLYFKALKIYTDSGNSKRRDDALLGIDEVYRAQGDIPEALMELAEAYGTQYPGKVLEIYSKALEIYTNTANSKGRADALFGLAQVHRTQRNYGEAVPLYSKALELYTEAENGLPSANSPSIWAQLCRQIGDRHEARDHEARAQAIYDEKAAIAKRRAEVMVSLTNVHKARGNRRGTADSLLGLAELHRTQRDYTRAVTIYDEALTIYTKIANSKGRADALLGISEVYQAQGNRVEWAGALLEVAEDHRTQRNYSNAVQTYSQALEVCTEATERLESAQSPESLRAEINYYIERRRYGMARQCEVKAEAIDDEKAAIAKMRSEALVGLISVHKAQGNRQGTADSLLGFAEFHRTRKDYTRAITIYFEAMANYTEISNRGGRADALLGLAEVHRAQRNYSEAVPLYSQALELYTEATSTKGRVDALLGLTELHRAQGHRQERADTLLELAEARKTQGNHSEASRAYSNALEIYTETADSKGTAVALLGIAEVYQAQGNRLGRADVLLRVAELHQTQRNYTEAVPLYSEALELYTEAENGLPRAESPSNWAQLCEAMGDHKGAREYQAKVQAIYDENAAIAKRRSEILVGLINVHKAQGNRQGTADSLLGFAEFHRTREDYTRAITIYFEAMAIYTEISNRGGRADALLGLAEVHRTQMNYSEAVPLYSQALELYTEATSTKGRVDALLGLTELHRAQGHIQERADTLLELAEARKTQGNHSEASWAYSEALEIYTKAANSKGTAAALLGIADVYQAQGNGSGRADVLLRVAELHRTQRNYSEAVPLNAEAVKIYTETENSTGREKALLSLAKLQEAQDNREGRADVMLELAELYRTQRNFSKALPIYSEILEILSNIPSSNRTADALAGLAKVHKAQCNLHWEADALLGLAEVRRTQVKYGEAKWKYSRALKLYTQTGDRRGRADAQLGLARLHEAQLESQAESRRT